MTRERERFNKISGWYNDRNIVKKVWRTDRWTKVFLQLLGRSYKSNMTTRQSFLKVTSLKNNLILPTATRHMHTEFETEILKQTWVMLWKTFPQQSLQIKNPIWLPGSHFENDCHWNSIGFYPYTQLFCYWSLELISKAKLKLESGNQKIQYGHQVAILNMTSLKNNRHLPMATISMHMKFEIEIPKQTWLMLRKPCCLQTDGQTV